MTRWIQFWKEKNKQQSTTGINVRPGLIVLINDVQEGTRAHLQTHWLHSALLADSDKFKRLKGWKLSFNKGRHMIIRKNNTKHIKDDRLHAIDYNTDTTIPNGYWNIFPENNQLYYCKNQSNPGYKQES